MPGACEHGAAENGESGAVAVLGGSNGPVGSCGCTPSPAVEARQVRSGRRLCRVAGPVRAPEQQVEPGEVLLDPTAVPGSAGSPARCRRWPSWPPRVALSHERVKTTPPILLARSCGNSRRNASCRLMACIGLRPGPGFVTGTEGSNAAVDAGAKPAPMRTGVAATASAANIFRTVLLSCQLIQIGVAVSDGSTTAQRRRSEGSVREGGSYPRSGGLRLVPGGTISSILSRTSEVRTVSAAPSWLSRCSAVRGPMMAEGHGRVARHEGQCQVDQGQAEAPPRRAGPVSRPPLASPGYPAGSCRTAAVSARRAG